MDDNRKEPRTVVMMRVKIMWEDISQNPCVAPATIEDHSRSGMCIRMSTRIIVGSKLTIKSHREEFSGVVANCRAVANGYVLGIKLNDAANADPEPPI